MKNKITTVQVKYPLGGLNLLEVFMGTIFEGFKNSDKYPENGNDKRGYIETFSSLYDTMRIITKPHTEDYLTGSGIADLSNLSKTTTFYKDINKLIKDLDMNVEILISNRWGLENIDKNNYTYKNNLEEIGIEIIYLN